MKRYLIQLYYKCIRNKKISSNVDIYILFLVRDLESAMDDDMVKIISKLLSDKQDPGKLTKQHIIFDLNLQSWTIYYVDFLQFQRYFIPQAELEEAFIYNNS